MLEIFFEKVRHDSSLAISVGQLFLDYILYLLLLYYVSPVIPLERVFSVERIGEDSTQGEGHK